MVFPKSWSSVQMSVLSHNERYVIVSRKENSQKTLKQHTEGTQEIKKTLRLRKDEAKTKMIMPAFFQKRLCRCFSIVFIIWILFKNKDEKQCYLRYANKENGNLKLVSNLSIVKHF